MSDKPVTMQDGVGRVELPIPGRLMQVERRDVPPEIQRAIEAALTRAGVGPATLVARVNDAEKMRDLTLQENSRLKDELDREREARQRAEKENTQLRAQLAAFASAPHLCHPHNTLTSDGGGICEHCGRTLHEQPAYRDALDKARAALRPFAVFAAKWDAKPPLNIDDEFYGIHTGTEHAASLRVSDCRRAKAALEAR